jgi:peptidyl-prolyl cis-trans isomerase SurA
MRRPVLLMLLSLVIPALAAADEMLVDGIAAQVGTDIVLISEVMQMVAPGERRLRAAGATETDIAQLRSEALESLIEARLIEHVVRNADLQATDAEVDETIAAIAQENGLDPEGLRETLTSQGMEYEQYRQEIRRELERRKVISAMVASRVHVDESEVKLLYRERFHDQPDGGVQFHLRQILVPAGEGEEGPSVEQSCGVVSEAEQLLEAGEPFEELAARYSAAAPQRGGDIGWLHEDAMASWMLELIQPLEEGQRTGVVALPFGCTLIELVERQEWAPVSYEEARPMLQAEVFESKVAEEYRSWMEEMRKNTFIERRGYFAQAARFGAASPGSESSALP